MSTHVSEGYIIESIALNQLYNSFFGLRFVITSSLTSPRTSHAWSERGRFTALWTRAHRMLKLKTRHVVVWFLDVITLPDLGVRFTALWTFVRRILKLKARQAAVRFTNVEGIIIAFGSLVHNAWTPVHSAIRHWKRQCKLDTRLWTWYTIESVLRNSKFGMKTPRS